jgi:hypothetical protein
MIHFLNYPENLTAYGKRVLDVCASVFSTTFRLNKYLASCTQAALRNAWRSSRKVFITLPDFN